MDDVLSGADSIEEILELQSELLELCRAGGFPLKTANDPRILGGIPKEDRLRQEPVTWTLGEDTHSILGLRWNPDEDCFSFSVTSLHESAITKRTILSDTARLFDPLGWLTPVIIKAKITIQTTWLLGLDWDAPLPEGEAVRWRQFQTELPLLTKIRVPRAIAKSSSCGLRTLHGFSDASERALSAVLYLKTEEGYESRVSLLTAKSRVAPVKQVTLSRLELCGALLLARLVNHAVKILELQGIPTYLWTDSTVTLGWIRGHPSKWKTYVANRVAEIQRLVPTLTGIIYLDEITRRIVLRGAFSPVSWWNTPCGGRDPRSFMSENR